jgi:hypothetical protein
VLSLRSVSRLGCHPFWFARHLGGAEHLSVVLTRINAGLSVALYGRLSGEFLPVFETDELRPLSPHRRLTLHRAVPFVRGVMTNRRRG